MVIDRRMQSIEYLFKKLKVFAETCMFQYQIAPVDRAADDIAHPYKEISDGEKDKLKKFLPLKIDHYSIVE